MDNIESEGERDDSFFRLYTVNGSNSVDGNILLKEAQLVKLVL